MHLFSRRNLAQLRNSYGFIAVTSIGFFAFIRTNSVAAPFDARGGQFIGIKSFSRFEEARGSRPGEIVLTSPVIAEQINWDQLIASWNAVTPPGTYLKVQARSLYLDHATKYFTLGLWSSDPSRYPRESVPGQRDDDGDVSTDTLILRHPT